MKIGDIVQLKSGGPQMTVSEISLRPDISRYPFLDIREQWLAESRAAQIPEYAICKWRNGEKFVEERFGLDALCVIHQQKKPMTKQIQELITWFEEMFDEWRGEFVSYTDPPCEPFSNRDKIIEILKNTTIPA